MFFVIGISGGDARLHVHFGAGRLGLGLVLPAVAASGAPFCVVQRPSSAFEPLERSPDEAGQPLTVALTVRKGTQLILRDVFYV